MKFTEEILEITHSMIIDTVQMSSLWLYRLNKMK